MFSIKTINKLQNELFNSLMSEFNLLDIKNKKEFQIFQYYKQLNSLAGMEIWLQSYHERKYFLDILNEIKNLKSYLEFEQLIKYIQNSLRMHFREEDFRFQDLESVEADAEKIKLIIQLIIQDLNKNLKSINNNFINNNSEIDFYKTNGSPWEWGLDLKIKKIQTSKKMIQQIQFAEKELQKCWVYGFELYKLLTKKIVIISSPGLVSFSHFNEPGISYLNVSDRDEFETIDDLVHENAHHHLNLILKKYNLIKDKKQLFYSPWREELRNSYAILHAVFTFSFGAFLFEKIILGSSPNLLKFKERAAFRLLEESKMLNFSLQDLFSIRNNFYKKGIEMLEYFQLENKRVLKREKEFYSMIKSPIYKKRLSQLEKSLKIARATYN